MAPTLIASYSIDSGGNNTNTLTTPSFTPANGEVVLVKGTTWFTGQTLNTPTGGAQTYTQLVVADVGGFTGYASIWGATVAGTPGAMTVSVTPAVSSWHHIVVERWHNAKLAASPAVNTVLTGNNTTPAVAANITTTAPGSIVSWCSVDENSTDPTNRSYLLSATEDGIFDGHVGTNSVQYFAYALVGPAGTYTMGMSAPVNQHWNLAGVEILDNTPPPPWDLVNYSGVTFNNGGTGFVYTLPSGAPNVGDLDILSVNSDTTVSTPAGFTLSPNASRVVNQGSYVFWRIAAGGEGSTVTVTTSGNFNTALGWQRWKGVLAWEAAANAGADGSPGTTTPAVSTSGLTTPDDLVVAFGMLHSYPSALPITPVWSAGFTGILAFNDGVVAGNEVTQFGAYKAGAGTAAENPNVSWTNNVGDRYIITLAFTPAIATPVVERQSGTPKVPSKLRRGRFFEAPISLLVAQPPAFMVSRRPRLIAISRKRIFSPPWPQGPQLYWDPTVIESRRSVTTRPVRRGRWFEPGWGQSTQVLHSLVVNVGRVITKWDTGLIVPSLWIVGEADLKWEVGDLEVTAISSQSLEYVRVGPVSAQANGVFINPTSDTVRMAFMASTVAPGVSDWKAATWNTVGVNQYQIQCLVGPGGATTLTTGYWYVWVQITDNPEVIVRAVDILQVTA